VTTDADPVAVPTHAAPGAPALDDASLGARAHAHEHEHVHEHDGSAPHAHPHVHVHPDAGGDTLAVSGAAAGSDPSAGRGTVELEHVHYRYPDGFEALRGVDLRIGAGEKVALVGPNGAGKSTLMLQLNGTLRPSHGSVRVAGLAIAKDTIRRVRAEVGLVFQDPDDQLFSPTVFDDVAFGPLHMGLREDEVHRRVEQALAAVGMEAFAHRVPHRMSLGQRKRVAVATVLSMDPSILVFDEPSAGLDPRGRRELIGLLRSLDQTMLVSTHDMRLVAEVFPRTVIVDGGLVVADGPTERLLSDEPLLERHGLEAP
jgi:cobalt/nickel transport system ATP-binding protein